MPQYWAQMIEMGREQEPTCTTCSSIEDAAYTQVNHFLEETGGEIVIGVVRVWSLEKDVHSARVFAWEAQLSLPDEQPGDLEDDEVEVEAEIALIERTS